MSAVNFNTQLRLEVQEGQIVWMFYNLENSAGFIISTSRIMEPRKWYHVLVDYSAKSGVARIFVDAVLQKKTLSRVRLNQEWLLGLRVGKYFSGGLEYKMDGFLDELQLHECILPQKYIDNVATTCGKFSCGENQQLQGKEDFSYVIICSLLIYVNYNRMFKMTHLRWLSSFYCYKYVLHLKVTNIC